MAQVLVMLRSPVWWIRNGYALGCLAQVAGGEFTLFWNPNMEEPQPSLGETYRESVILK